MTLDKPWAIEQMQHFLLVTTEAFDGYTTSPQMGDAEAFASAEVLEQILDRVMPEWRQGLGRPLHYAWTYHRECAHRAITRLGRADELAQKLGDNAPNLSAASLHPWVWDSARSLWNSGHYRKAVEAAAQGVNAYTQQKIGRRDVSEGDLFKQAFSENAPELGKPRLRPKGYEDDTPTSQSVRRGIRDLASGCYALIRNPTTHEDPTKEMREHEALEALAAFSLLARWVDAAGLVFT